MPWCPRCDEIFPGGSTCPRCRARLEAPDVASGGHGLQPVEDLPQLKVPRRYRRAFDRLSEPKGPSQRALIAAGTALVFAVGFLFGRLLSQPPSPPTVHALPPAVPLSTLDVDGSAAYLVWSPGEHLATIATHDLYSGEVSPRARLSPPSADPGERTQVAALGEDLALVLGDGEDAYVAIAPGAGAPFGWVQGVEAAWEAPGSLLLRTSDGRVLRWSAQTRQLGDALPGRWTGLLQTPSGAALRRGDALVLSAPGRPGKTLSLPPRSTVLAVDPSFSRALVVSHGLMLWDGKAATPLRIDGYKALAAAFSSAGDKVAVTLADADGSMLVGVSDTKGNLALKPVPAQSTGCVPTPAWDARGRWVYLAPGDGSLYAVESAGARVEGVPAHLVGCGLAWFSS
jgi:hypothetical protein